MNFWHDLKFAARSLARVKGFAATVVITLALGIGANAAIYGVVRGVLPGVRVPSALPILGAAAILLAAAIVASVLPALRAARTDVMVALRSD
jgi:hypothetical protein